MIKISGDVGVLAGSLLALGGVLWLASSPNTKIVETSKVAGGEAEKLLNKVADLNQSIKFGDLQAAARESAIRQYNATLHVLKDMGVDTDFGPRILAVKRTVPVITW